MFNFIEHIQNIRKSDQFRQLIGIILILIAITNINLSILTIFFGDVKNMDKTAQMMLRNMENQSVFLNQEEQTFFIHQQMIDEKFFNVITVLLFVPLLILGFRYLTKREYRLWSWQVNRIKRHPFLSYVFFFFGLNFLSAFVPELLDPTPYNFPIQPRFPLLMWFIPAIISFIISLWFYIGRKKRMRPEFNPWDRL